MKINFSSLEEMARYFNFIAQTENDVIRLKAAWNCYVTNYRGDGNYGCIAEILTATPHSNKRTVSNSGHVDCRILWKSESGRVVPVSVERKTNGGRIETVETEFSVAEKMSGKFVVYSMDICNSGTSYLRRHVDAVIVPKTLFLAKLKEFGAIKTVRHNGQIDGYAIQVTCKPWYLWLSEYPVKYERDRVYMASDFIGLE